MEDIGASVGLLFVSMVLFLSGENGAGGGADDELREHSTGNTYHGGYWSSEKKTNRFVRSVLVVLRNERHHYFRRDSI